MLMICGTCLSHWLGISDTMRLLRESECLSPTSYDFHAYSPLVCSYCHSLDHDANSCPYSDISDECYAKLDA